MMREIPGGLLLSLMRMQSMMLVLWGGSHHLHLHLYLRVRVRVRVRVHVRVCVSVRVRVCQ